MRKTTTKKVIKLRGDTFSRSGPIAKNVEGGGQIDPPPVGLGLRLGHTSMQILQCAAFYCKIYIKVTT